MKTKILLLSLVLMLVVGLVAMGCPAPTPPPPTPPAPPPPPPPPPPEVIEWDVSFWGGPGARVWPVWPWYEEEIVKRTDGRFKVTIHHGAALAPSKEQLDGLKAGLYEMCHFASAYHPGKNPLMSFFDLPGLAPADLKEKAQLELAFMEHPAAQEEMLYRWNAVYIGLAHTRPNYTFLGTKPIRSLADFDGMRSRTPAPVTTLLEKWGGVGLLIPAPEVYEAIAKGTLDQSFFAPASHQGYKIHEVSQYYTYGVPLGAGMGWFLVANADAWAALPEDIKAIHWELVEELMLERLPAEMGKKVDEIFADWEARGIEFIEFPAEDAAEMEAAAKPTWEEYAKSLDAQGLPGTEMLEYLLAKRMEISGY